MSSHIRVDEDKQWKLLMRDRKDGEGESHTKPAFFPLPYLCYISLWHKDMQRA